MNPIQVNASNMEPSKLVAEYGSDIVFFGGIDENEALKHGSPETVRNATRCMIDTLGKHGRYIVAPSHDQLLPEVPAANIVEMYREAKLYGTGKALYRDCFGSGVDFTMGRFTS